MEYRGYPMANSPFDAALRAHASRGSYSGVFRIDRRSRRPHAAAIAPRSLDFSREFEAALLRELGAGAGIAGAGDKEPAGAEASPTGPAGRSAIEDRAVDARPTGPV